MRLIPVIDLKNGLAMHAVRGDRARYRPATSALVNRGDARALARAYRQLGLEELYIADLDAIQGLGQHRSLIAELARQQDVRIMVDAGAADVAQAQQVLALGVHKVIIALETLAHWADLGAIYARLPPGQVVFSLDLRGRQVVARAPDLAALSPVAMLQRLQVIGCQEVILLDTARFGTGAGVDLKLITEARAQCPGMELLAGGGVRNIKDVTDLQAAGAAGALVATALHLGNIRQQDIAALKKL